MGLYLSVGGRSPGTRCRHLRATACAGLVVALKGGIENCCLLRATPIDASCSSSVVFRSRKTGLRFTGCGTRFGGVCGTRYGGICGTRFAKLQAHAGNFWSGLTRDCRLLSQVDSTPVCRFSDSARAEPAPANPSASPLLNSDEDRMACSSLWQHMSSTIFSAPLHGCPFTRMPCAGQPRQSACIQHGIDEHACNALAASLTSKVRGLTSQPSRHRNASSLQCSASCATSLEGTAARMHASAPTWRSVRLRSCVHSCAVAPQRESPASRLVMETPRVLSSDQKEPPAVRGRYAWDSKVSSAYQDHVTQARGCSAGSRHGCARVDERQVLQRGGVLRNGC